MGDSEDAEDLYPASQSMQTVAEYELAYVPLAQATQRVDDSTAAILPGVHAVHRPAWSRL